MRYSDGHSRSFCLRGGLWYAGDVESSHRGVTICKKRNDVVHKNLKDQLLGLLGLLFLPGVCVGCCITYGCYRQRIKTSKGEQRANIQMREVQPQKTQHGFVQQNHLQHNVQYLPNQQQWRSSPIQVYSAPRANAQPQEGAIHHGNQPTYTVGAAFSGDSSNVIKA